MLISEKTLVKLGCLQMNRCSYIVVGQGLLKLKTNSEIGSFFGFSSEEAFL